MNHFGFEDSLDHNKSDFDFIGLTIHISMN